MTIENFDSELSLTLLKRGKDYFRNGQITDLEEKRNGIWTALAFGSDEYEVEIHLKGIEVEDTVCSCPFDGLVCKHAIGTMFAIREETSGETSRAKRKKSSNPKKKLNKEEKLELIRQKAEVPVLLDILFREAIINKELCNQLFIRFSDLWGESTLKIVLKNIKASLEKAEHIGYRDYHASSRVANELFMYLKEAKKAFERQDFELAFGIPMGIIKMAIPVFYSVDDSSGELTDVVYSSIRQIEEWMVEMPKESELKQNLMKQVQDLVQSGLGSGFGFTTDLFDLVCELTESVEDKVWLISYSQARVTNELVNGELPWESKKDIQNLVRVLIICGKEKDANDLRLKYRDKIHDFLLELYKKEMVQGNSEKAKVFIEEGIENPGYSNFNNEWRLKLSNWYLEAGDRKNYLDNLFKAVVNMNLTQANLKELKSKMEKGEWTDLRMKWLGVCKGYKPKNNWDPGMKSSLLELLLEANEIEAMWQEVKLSGFSFLEKYHSFFMENYQAEVLERFKNYVFSQMEQPGSKDRKTYQTMAHYLMKIKKLGGIEMANQAKRDILAKYKGRPALVDELKGV